MVADESYYSSVITRQRQLGGICSGRYKAILWALVPLTDHVSMLAVLDHGLLLHRTCHSTQWTIKNVDILFLTITLVPWRHLVNAYGVKAWCGWLGLRCVR